MQAVEQDIVEHLMEQKQRHQLQQETFRRELDQQIMLRKAMAAAGPGARV